MTLRHVLIVDDDVRLRRLIQKYLTQNGFTVSEASKPSEASELLALFKFDAIIMDVMMPEQDGISYTHKLRQQEMTAPILILTAKGDSQSRITGLESGADDYLPKPFEPKELLLRLNNLIKRQSVEDKRTIHFGKYIYEIDIKRLRLNDEVIPLTTAEQELLEILIQNPNKTLSREELANMTHQENIRTIDVQITRLRKKIESDAKAPLFIQTVRGKGYRFVL